MPNPRQDLQVDLYDGYALSNLIQRFTGLYARLDFSTRFHGGFNLCHLTVPWEVADIVLALNRENLPGYHFYHLRITEDHRVVWEGRLFKLGHTWDERGNYLTLVAQGYWGSCRDRLYDAADAGNTDWTAGTNQKFVWASFSVAFNCKAAIASPGQSKTSR